MPRCELSMLHRRISRWTVPKEKEKKACHNTCRIEEFTIKRWMKRGEARHWGVVFCSNDVKPSTAVLPYWFIERITSFEDCLLQDRKKHPGSGLKKIVLRPQTDKRTNQLPNADSKNLGQRFWKSWDWFGYYMTGRDLFSVDKERVWNR